MELKNCFSRNKEVKIFDIRHLFDYKMIEYISERSYAHIVWAHVKIKDACRPDHPKCFGN